MEDTDPSSGPPSNVKLYAEGVRYPDQLSQLPEAFSRTFSAKIGKIQTNWDEVGLHTVPGRNGSLKGKHSSDHLLSKQLGSSSGQAGEEDKLSMLFLVLGEGRGGKGWGWS